MIRINRKEKYKMYKNAKKVCYASWYFLAEKNKKAKNETN